MKKIFFLIPLLLILTGCALSNKSDSSPQTKTEATKPIAIIAKAPTATNFPRIGTATPIPPTVTPHATATSLPQRPIFDDATLEKLMAGTISSAGIGALVDIQDNRATGGERIANITIESQYNLEDNDLLMKLFVLEVGNALRTIRAFSEGDMQADLDSAHLIVNDKKGNLMGTVTAPMSNIVEFLDGKTSTIEALKHLSATGVFKSFIEDYQ